jgi:hypothetical protein
MTFGFTAKTGGTTAIDTETRTLRVRQKGTLIGVLVGSSLYRVTLPSMLSGESLAIRLSAGAYAYCASAMFGDTSLGNIIESGNGPFTLDYGILTEAPSIYTETFGLMLKDSSGSNIFDSRAVTFRTLQCGSFRVSGAGGAGGSITLSHASSSYIVFDSVFQGQALSFDPSYIYGWYSHIGFLARTSATTSRLDMGAYWYSDGGYDNVPSYSDLPYIVGELV